MTTVPAAERGGPDDLDALLGGGAKVVEEPSVSRARDSVTSAFSVELSSALCRAARSSRASSSVTLAASSRGLRSGAPGTTVAATRATAPPMKASAILLGPWLRGSSVVTTID